jgi:ubiquinone biosynthesis UbiH/UbiF/VisC/COQ6 family hydroxylase
MAKTTKNKQTPNKQSPAADFDVLVVGGGPVGLSFARMMAPLGCRIGVIEKQPLDKIARPADDGREVAVTHRSREILSRNGMLDIMPPDALHILRAAQVIDRGTAQPLEFSPEGSGKGNIGFVIANHHIRKAAYDAATVCKNIEIMTGETVTGLTLGSGAASVTLERGKTLSAPLVVAADNRFSTLRDMAGVETRKLDFKRLCIVVKITHSKPHDDIASECFLDGLTLALIPLGDKAASAVLTLPIDEGKKILTLSPEDLAEKIYGWADGRIGQVRVTGEMHSYPLVGVYAQEFAKERFALLGDAAVGMHPVSAHGFNFGLYGAEALSQALRRAMLSGLDIGKMSVLAEFAAIHRRQTRPMYEGINSIVQLYTDDRPAAKLLRKGVLAAGHALKPVQRLIVGNLTREKSTE